MAYPLQIPTFVSVSQCRNETTGDTGRVLTRYQIPTTETVVDPHCLLRRAEIGEKHPESASLPRRVALFVGETGSGKTTMVNGMVNYIYGVNYEDNFRLQLIPPEKTSQAISQTMFITEYVLNWQPHFRHPFTLVIIDSPGFGDTRGIDQDDWMIKQAEKFFTKVVHHVDLVGFVMPSAPARLTERQIYIFNGILSIFGKDIEENVYLLITYCDNKKPSVLSAVNEGNVSYQDYFKFNNSVFVDDEKGDDEDFDLMFWKMACTSFEKFLKKLNQLKPKSLTMTREVLVERRRLQETIDVLSMRINDGVNHLAVMRAELLFIHDYEAARDANQNYTRIINVPKTRKVHFEEPNRHVTNCTNCSHTCHENCAIANDAEKFQCAAMDSTGKCMNCKNRCHWSVHFNYDYVFEDYLEKETITIADMADKYGKAIAGLTAKEAMVVNILEEFNKVQKDVLDAAEQIRRCIERLGEIALRPDPMTAVQYIDMLIKATKRDKKNGWEQRLEQLESARSRAAMIKEMMDKKENYDPFENLLREIAQSKPRGDGKSGVFQKLKNFFKF